MIRLNAVDFAARFFVFGAFVFGVFFGAFGMTTPPPAPAERPLACAPRRYALPTYHAQRRT
jgi:hypothetical protein